MGENLFAIPYMTDSLDMSLPTILRIWGIVFLINEHFRDMPQERNLGIGVYRIETLLLHKSQPYKSQPYK